MPSSTPAQTGPGRNSARCDAPTRIAWKRRVGRRLRWKNERRGAQIDRSINSTRTSLASASRATTGVGTGPSRGPARPVDSPDATRVRYFYWEHHEVECSIQARSASKGKRDASPKTRPRIPSLARRAWMEKATGRRRSCQLLDAPGSTNAHPAGPFAEPHRTSGKPLSWPPGAIPFASEFLQN